MSTFTSVIDDASSLKAEECLIMETAQKFGVGTKSGGSRKPLNGFCLTTNVEKARKERVLHGRSALLFKACLFWNFLNDIYTIYNIHYIDNVCIYIYLM